MLKTHNITLQEVSASPSFRIFSAVIISLVLTGLLYALGVTLNFSIFCGALSLLVFIVGTYAVPRRATADSIMKKGIPMEERCHWNESEPDKDDEPADSSEVRSAREILPADLKEAGMQPEWDEDTLCFRYLGGYFRAVNLDNDVIRIIYPRIYSVSAPYQDLLCRLLNRINSSYGLVKVIATAVPDEDDIEVYAFADIYYTSAMADRQSLLSAILSIFFEVQKALVMSSSVNAVDEDDEDFDTTCETAYRGFSLN